MSDANGSIYLPRLADERLAGLVRAFPAVLVNGPRAAGKTTTARQLAAEVVQLDSPRRAAAFRADPDVALRLVTEPVLLDEWQEVPEVLGAVKRAVDADSRPGRFILTGSVRAALEQRMWPGTGRLVRLSMYGLTEREIAGGARLARPGFLDRLAAGDPDDLTLPEDVPDLQGYVARAVRGGFPEVALRGLGDADRRTWLDGYLEQLLNRDAMALGAGARDPERLRRYFETLALNTAGLPTDKTLYESAGVTAKTAAAYDDLLAGLFVLDRLPAWSTNRLSRLVSTAKRYLADTGLAAASAGLSTRSVIADGDLLGRILDTFVVAQLRPEAALSVSRHRLFHLRTKGGRQEVDLLVELDGGRLLAIEVKATSAPRSAHAGHLRWLRDELGGRFVRGAVLHTGPSVFPLDDRILAVPICAIWG